MDGMNIDDLLQPEVTRSPRHVEALRLANLGYKIFPCEVGGKKPATQNGFKDASSDPAQINAWFAEADYNVAYEPGAHAEHVVDLDGASALTKWITLCLDRGDLPREVHAVRTPGDARKGREPGLHLYFKGSIPSSVGLIAPKIDTRSKGGYVLLPPSVINGVEYLRGGFDGDGFVSKHFKTAYGPTWVKEFFARRDAARKSISSHASGDPVDVRDVRAQLGMIDPDCARDRWRNVIWGVFAANLIGGDESGERRLALVTDWSAGKLDAQQRYAADPPTKWEGVEPILQIVETDKRELKGGAAVSYGTLYQHAREEGYNHPANFYRDGGDKKPSEVFDPVNYVTQAHQAEREEARSQIRIRFRSVKPSVAARRPQPSHWDKDKTFLKSPPDGFSITLVVAQYGHHKTNFALMKTLDTIAHGNEVVYCVGEALADFATQRVPAQCAVRDLKLEELDGKLHIVETVPDCSEPLEVEAFIEEHLHRRGKATFVFDTLSDAMVTVDENDAKQMRIVLMDGVLRIAEALCCDLVLVHHMGKDRSKGSRGSTVLPAKADAIWELSFNAKAGTVEQYVEKMRGGRARFSVLFGTRIVPINGAEVMTTIPLKPEQQTEARAKLKAAAREERNERLGLAGGLAGDVERVLFSLHKASPDPLAAHFTTGVVTASFVNTGLPMEGSEEANIRTVERQLRRAAFDQRRGENAKGPLARYVVFNKLDQPTWEWRIPADRLQELLDNEREADEIPPEVG